MIMEQFSVLLFFVKPKKKKHSHYVLTIFQKLLINVKMLKISFNIDNKGGRGGTLQNELSRCYVRRIGTVSAELTQVSH